MTKPSTPKSASGCGGNHVSGIMRSRLTALMLGLVACVVTATYDFPLDPSAEVVMTASFDGAAAKGTWSLRPKGQTDELAGGGVAVTKK